jgi:small subunit ribosomal protein S15
MLMRSSLLRVLAPAQSARSFSSSPAAFVKKSILKIRATERKEVNLLRQKYISEKNSNIDPVLGHPNNPFLNRLEAEVREPNVLGKGYKLTEVEKLLYGAQQASVNDTYASATLGEATEKQREAIMRILSMKNRSDAEILKFKVDFAKREFQRFEGDTGSSEVQAAVATVRIHHLYKHCEENKKDLQNVRLLRMLVQKRQRILRYLKRDQPERYYWAINKLGLTDHIVHMEFNMDRRYMQKFKMYGDRILIRESKSVQEEERKQKRKEKKILKHKSVKELRAMKRALDRTSA